MAVVAVVVVDVLLDGRVVLFEALGILIMIRKCMVPSWTVRRWCSSGVGDFPPRKEVRSLGVAGAGQMGTGIGIVAAQVAQLDVVFFDRDKVERPL